MIKNDIIILGIESSCDDTSAAILKNEAILSNEIAGQKVHEAYGGVVPELASRAHQQNILPVVDAAIKNAEIDIKDIDAIAFTRGPGLLGSLIVGTSFAKSLALGLNIPMMEVNHMHGHVLAHFIDDEGKEKPQFPFICLTISGGHTQIVVVNDYLDMEVVGTTKDDAAGEAFDKTAKLLGLPYPGGPLIDKYAKLGNPKAFKFTAPNMSEFDFSFSGLKTNVLQFLQRNTKNDQDFVTNNINDICASLQQTIVDILFDKLIKATRHFNIHEVAIAGGVSANSGIRQRLKDEGVKRNWNTHIPKFEYCTDNAAMIAITGRYHYLKGNFAEQSISPDARLKI
ncbi:MAG TPA: tRNA (adenosine(37)-N6)-threonylcarbamoyltransferase complex transferase subunit TsaD [Brumimicrobium sp.]|nr:tRNA (adenosine(37)-N6)-threonylcarbamoyltransferase complex transferase subunit TsaD [Brumimicrobium sp.]